MEKGKLTADIRKKIFKCLQDAIASADDIDTQQDKAKKVKREQETRATTPPKPNPG